MIYNLLNILKKGASVIQRVVSVLAVLFVLCFAQLLQAVSVVPNQGIIEGEVEGYCMVASSVLNIVPEQIIHILSIKVSAVRDLEGKQNFTREKVGQVIKVHSKEKPAGNLVGHKIIAEVTYLGDERGGLFWLNSINTIKGGEP